MATVHQQAALAFLEDAKKNKLDADKLRAAIDTKFSGWGNNAAPMTGYNDTHHHVSLIVSRSLHDVLPVGRSAYAWDYQHGFNDVMKFFDLPQADAKAAAKLIDDGIAELKRVMAN